MDHKIAALVFKTRAHARFQHDAVLYACCTQLSLSCKKTSALDLKIPGKEGFSRSLNHIWFHLLALGSHSVFLRLWDAPLSLICKMLKKSLVLKQI